MATQTLEFSAASGLTLSCKLFALESDTVVDTQAAIERTNDKNRYRVAFTDVPAGAYRLNAFVGAVGGFANEVYDLTPATDVFLPRSEIAGGLGGFTVVPYIASMRSRVTGTTIEVFTGETVSVAVSVNDASGNAVDLTDLTLSLVIESRSGTDVTTVADGSISKSDGSFSFTLPSSVSNNEGTYRWALRNTADDGVLAYGPLTVAYAPAVDA